LRRLAIAEALAGLALLCAMDALIKGVAQRFPVFEVAFARYLFGSLLILGLAAVARPGWPSAETLRANGLRALLVVITATTFYYALARLPLAETIALSFLSPIFVALAANLVLGETIDRRIVSGLGAGFAGMLVIVAGQTGLSFGGSFSGVAAVLVSAVTYALSMVLLRARAQTDPVVTIVTIQNVAPAAILLVPALLVWQQPSPADWGVLALLGTLGVLGHLLMARAYAKAQAARLASLEYTALLWASLFGFAFFGEVPTPTTLAGAALIIGGAVMASRR
jgi:drug/metabolite transporter (DMT)-like permease